MNFIEITQNKNTKFLILIDSITSIQTTGDKVYINLTDGQRIIPEESYDEIILMIDMLRSSEIITQQHLNNVYNSDYTSTTFYGNADPNEELPF